MHTFVGLLQLHHVAKCSSRATHSLCLRGLLRPRRFCDRLGQGLEAGLIHRLFDPTSQSGRGWGDTVRAVRTDPSQRGQVCLYHLLLSNCFREVFEASSPRKAWQVCDGGLTTEGHVGEGHVAIIIAELVH